jgi:transcriptional regulator with XRE-family HTH domain
VAAPTAPDPDLVATAYELTLEPPAGEGLSLAQVAVRLGISKATAWNYVQRAIAHRPFVELHKRAVAQSDMSKRLLAMLYAAYALAEARYPDPDDEDADEARWLAIMDFAAKREAQLAELLGLKSPAKLDITTNGGRNGDGAPRDTKLIEALARIEERDTLDDREIRAGRPGVIEGGT